LSRAISKSGNLALRVAKKDAQSCLEEVCSLKLLDTRRKILIRGDEAEIPLKEPLPGRETIVQKEPEFYNKMPSLSDVLDDLIPQEDLFLLPKGWMILGKVIVVKISPDLSCYKCQIGRALLTMYPRCSCVLRDYGIEGELREPVREVIAGSGSETVHRENGVLFKLDAQKVMFSPGNLKERIRMSRLGRGETVVDMFSGIGYFSIPMAVHSRPEKIISIELNPVAYSYLVDNVKANHVDDVVFPVQGDCRELTPEGSADRVIMGYVGTTDRYLKKGIMALRSGGMMHYHQTVPSWLFPDALEIDVISAAKEVDRKAKVLKSIKVKKYSPGVLHAVIDARID
jgi:tRNA wybutosine-synthesizing protein 2